MWQSSDMAAIPLNCHRKLSYECNVESQADTLPQRLSLSLQLPPAGEAGRTQPSTHFSQMRRDSHSAAADGGEPRLKVLVIVAELESIGVVTPLIVTAPEDLDVTVPLAEEELDDLTTVEAASPTHRHLIRIMILPNVLCSPRRRPGIQLPQALRRQQVCVALLVDGEDPVQQLQ